MNREMYVQIDGFFVALVKAGFSKCEYYNF